MMETVEYIFNIPNENDEYLLFIDGKRSNIHWKINKKYVNAYDKNSKIFEYKISDLMGYDILHIDFYNKGTLKEYKEQLTSSYGKNFDMRKDYSFMFYLFITDILRLYYENIMARGRISIKPFNYVFYYPQSMIDEINSMNDYRMKILTRYGFKKKFLIKDLHSKKMKRRKLSVKQKNNLKSLLLI